ncbi:MAG: hypothetical protein ABIA56_05240 [Actinomycetota bacterium]
MQNKIKRVIEKQLIDKLEQYDFEFNEHEVGCELFNLLKKDRRIVRAQYRIRLQKGKYIIPDLAILNKKCEIINPIEIKSRQFLSIKGLKGALFVNGKKYCECESIYRLIQKIKCAKGTAIFINKIRHEDKSILESLEDLDIDSVIPTKYDPIQVYYLEFIFKKKPRFIGGLIIHNGEIQRLEGI